MTSELSGSISCLYLTSFTFTVTFTFFILFVNSDMKNSHFVFLNILNDCWVLLTPCMEVNWLVCKGHPFMTSTKMTNFLTPLPYHPQKWTIDLLFKNNRIRKHVTNYKLQDSPNPLPYGRHKCMVPKAN